MIADIRFIAKMAGVSPATVSRVVNHSKPVNNETYKRVMSTIEKFNYRPNSMARGLILKKSRLIGVMVPNVSNFFHSKLVSAIEQYADSFGYNVIISNIHNDFEHQRRNYLGLCERQVDGMLLLHENTEKELFELKKLSDTPTVLTSVHIPNCDLASVAINDEQAAFDAVMYLIELGHSKIGAIFNDCNSLGVLRRKGLQRALTVSGQKEDSNRIIYGNCTIEDGAKQTETLFSHSEHPTALFCVSDEIAVGAIDWLTDHNLPVPEQVSVIGFDDISLSKSIRPKLTTVHQPIEEIGSTATRLLIDIIEGNDINERHIILPHKLMIRNSCTQPYPDIIYQF